MTGPFVSEVHNYEADPQSGAGNCVCGRPRDNKNHPHEFRKAKNFSFCVCLKPADALVHQMSSI